MRSRTTRRVRSAPASYLRRHAHSPELVQRPRSGLSIRGAGNDRSHARYSSHAGARAAPGDALAFTAERSSGQRAGDCLVAVALVRPGNRRATALPAKALV